MSNAIRFLAFTALAGVIFSQGCARHNKIDGIDYNCPSPSKDQIDKNGFLILKNGVTLECQVKNYTSRMSCTGITDTENTNGWMCSNREKQILFIFDENGVLKGRKVF